MPGQTRFPDSAPVNPRASKRRKARTDKPETIARRERDAECVRLRRGGMSWDAIARTLDYGGAGSAYRAFMEFMRAYPKEDANESRQLELDRLDAVQQAIWVRCLDSDDKDQHWAIDRFLKISDQRARLMGLNKPVRQEISVLSEHTVDDAIVALQEQLASQALAAGVELPALRAATEVIRVTSA